MKIINTTNINQARKEIVETKKKNPAEKIGLLSQDEEFNRKALEIKGLDTFILNEELDIKDYSKQRNSGLNESFTKLAAKSGIAIGIQIEEIIKKKEIEKARALARLAQNILLCKKSGTRLIFLGNIKDKQALRSLIISLEGSTKQAQESIK